MLIALSVKNKTEVIDGTLEKSSTSEVNMYNSWMHNNNLIISWILNLVLKEISTSIMFAEIADKIWTNLKECLC